MQLNIIPDSIFNTDFDRHDRALHYGDGLFETMLKIQNEIPLWPAHYARLKLGCEKLSIPVPGADWLESLVTEKSRHLDKAIVKIIVSRGRGGRGLQLPDPKQASCFAFCYPWTEPPQTEHKVTICQTRLPINRNLAGIKHLNRLDYVLASIELHAKPEVTEGILCNGDGFIVEGMNTNIFFFGETGLHTPLLDVAGVNGIMRQLVINRAREMNILVMEGRYNPTDLLRSKECFLCNSVRGITPIVLIDQKPFDIGPQTTALMAALNP